MSLRLFFFELGLFGFGLLIWGVFFLFFVSLRFEIFSFSFSGGVEKRKFSFFEECFDEEAKGDCLEFSKLRKGFLSCLEVA